MKKVLIVALLIALSSGSAYSESFSHFFTDGLRNGYSFEGEEGFSVHNQYGYIQGMLDALKMAGKDTSLRRMNDIKRVHNVLRNYYIAYPEERARPIVDLVVAEYSIKSE